METKDRDTLAGLLRKAALQTIGEAEFWVQFIPRVLSQFNQILIQARKIFMALNQKLTNCFLTSVLEFSMVPF
jgi:hypothetical protein